MTVEFGSHNMATSNEIRNRSVVEWEHTLTVLNENEQIQVIKRKKLTVGLWPARLVFNPKKSEDYFSRQALAALSVCLPKKSEDYFSRQALAALSVCLPLRRFTCAINSLSPDSETLHHTLWRKVELCTDNAVVASHRNRQSTLLANVMNVCYELRSRKHLLASSALCKLLLWSFPDGANRDLTNNHIFFYFFLIWFFFLSLML